jgi:manganese transport protein
MQGFIRRRIPLYLRRGLTMAPSLVILAIGVNTTDTLVLSQVVLSFGIPFALIPMVMLTSRRSVMGSFVNTRLTTVVASTVALLVVALNGFLIYDTIFG